MKKPKAQVEKKAREKVMQQRGADSGGGQGSGGGGEEGRAEVKSKNDQNAVH